MMLSFRHPTPKEKQEWELEYETRLLFRLQILIDVIYGLIIFGLFSLLPTPTAEQIQTRDFDGILTELGNSAVILLIGIVLVIIYWGQSNVQLGNLKHADKRFSVIALLQIFALLLYFYFVGLDQQTEGEALTLLAQSVFLAISGFLGVYLWSYSRHQGLLSDYLSEEKYLDNFFNFFSEPITATLTIPFALLGPDWYGASWLLLIPIGLLLKRRKKKRQSQVREALEDPS